VIDLIVSALDWCIQRDSLTSQLRALGVPFWPWDTLPTLRRRLSCAVCFGWPSENADPRWMESYEAQMMRAELRLMRALGVARR
jgi:hypothetical protein